MSDRTPPLSEALTDEQMRAFYGDADAMLTAQCRMDTALADLTQAPFDAQAQSAMAEYLSSEELQRATAAARRIGGMS
ncbi:hypothetical protein ACIA8I_41590 [Streptomyces rishiriensis]|uniref:hypothetical protein n=1 Tax=Streptomyces rishiriensis TaxID=68264 RepID=UPI00379A2508